MSEEGTIIKEARLGKANGWRQFPGALKMFLVLQNTCTANSSVEAAVLRPLLEAAMSLFRKQWLKTGQETQQKLNLV